ncbi:hypothetical protein P7K49_010056, partial [Saguinus oedipus]
MCWGCRVPRVGCVGAPGFVGTRTAWPGARHPRLPGTPEPLHPLHSCTPHTLAPLAPLHPPYLCTPCTSTP